MATAKMRNHHYNSSAPKQLIHRITFGSLVLSATLASAAATAQTRLCAIYPHLKDSYWLSVNYGMVTKARELGAQLKVLESGGYPNIEKQRQQLSDCASWGADAIILGTVSPTAYDEPIAGLTGDIPVFATVNRLNVTNANSATVKGKVGVDWYWMGYKAGQFLAKRHPAGSGITNIAWLPGPQHRGGTKPVAEGFLEAVKGSDIRIRYSLWADNDKELQRNLIQQVLADSGDIAYIVGSAVAIEAAISELRSAGKQQQIALISTYLSHGVYRGIRRNRVLFAPTDKMVLQGALSVTQAFNYLNDKSEFEPEYSPKIEPLTPDHLPKQVLRESLSPPEFRPVYQTGSTQTR